MKIAIIGVGAMGCLLAAYLETVADVVQVGHWPAQIVTLQQQGLRLIHPDGRVTRHAWPVTNQAASADPADAALVLVKSWQTAPAAQEIQQLLAPTSVAITLQNGLSNWETLTAVLGPRRVALGVTAQGAAVIQPGVVRHAGHGPTHLARQPETASVVAAVADLFNQVGLETHLTDNADSLVWGKLAVNAGINPLTALLRVPNGFLAENETARSIMQRAAAEVAAVAQAQGVALPYDDAGQRALEVAQATAANLSSMLQDVQRGAPTEIDAICGAVVRYGRHCGVATPINEKLLQLVKEARAKDWTLEINKLHSLILNPR